MINQTKVLLNQLAKHLEIATAQQEEVVLMHLFLRRFTLTINTKEYNINMG